MCGSLGAPRTIAVCYDVPMSAPISLPTVPTVKTSIQRASSAFFGIFSFHFIGKGPCSRTAFGTNAPITIVARDVSQTLFNSARSTNGRFLLGRTPCHIMKMIGSMSALTSTSCNRM